MTVILDNNNKNKNKNRCRREGDIKIYKMVLLEYRLTNDGHTDVTEIGILTCTKDTTGLAISD